MNSKLLAYLVKKGLITQKVAYELLSACGPDKTARDLLLERNLVAEEDILNALSDIYHMPVVNLYDATVPKEVRNLLKADVLRTHVVFPFGIDPVDNHLLLVAVDNPLNLRARDVVSLSTDYRVQPHLAQTGQILLAIDRCFGSAELQEAAEQYAGAQAARDGDRSLEQQAMQEDVNSSPVVVLVNSLVEQAVRQRASDIHIEALEDMVQVRFRIDGVLYQRATYDIQILAAIVTRVKVMSGLYISEKRKPQDGQFSAVVDRQTYDVRVSTLPTVYGEKCVLRIAQKKALNRDKSELGMTPQEISKFDAIFAKPYGIVLVTGPTGSGKSTTLYTALSGLNKTSVNIVTIEDPVEANIRGINQVQVNTKAELTFASALRSILRQDPDIIMIGEIRDSETAGIAIQASITGHLVVSTLHTNDTASSITRLLNMGVESYLIADATTGIIAQRLVRRLCPHCKRKRLIQPREADYLEIEEQDRGSVYVWDSVGCQRCSGTGFFDRIGVYEFMEITPGLRALIARRASTDELRQKAIEEGMSTLRESAKRLVLEGVTTVTEMARISMESNEQTEPPDEEAGT